MHYRTVGFVLVISLIVAICQWSTGQEPTSIIGSRWWPSEWGADDQRGALNRITPAKVVQASRLIKEGKVYELGRV